MSGCYYDSVPVLYPNASVCDTTNVTYSKTIQPILSSQCYTCHEGSTPTGGLILTDYNSVMVVVNMAS